MQTADSGRVVVLTGANEGIGHGMLTTLLDGGYRVAALDVNTTNLDALAERYGEQLRVYECDVTSDADVEATVGDVLEAWGHIDVLLNNAAIFNFGLVQDRTFEDTHEEFDVNVFGPLRLVHAILPHMRERGAGKIHFVSSGVGRVGNPGLSGYGATKGALEAYARSLRLELQNEAVSVTVMHPSLAKTQGATVLGYPDSMMADPAVVGRKLARKIETSKPVVYADLKTRFGIKLAQLFPSLVKRTTRRFLDETPTTSTPDSEATAPFDDGDAPRDEGDDDSSTSDEPSESEDAPVQAGSR